MARSDGPRPVPFSRHCSAVEHLPASSPGVRRPCYQRANHGNHPGPDPGQGPDQGVRACAVGAGVHGRPRSTSAEASVNGRRPFRWQGRGCGERGFSGFMVRKCRFGRSRRRRVLGPGGGSRGVRLARVVEYLGLGGAGRGSWGEGVGITTPSQSARQRQEESRQRRLGVAK